MRAAPVKVPTSTDVQNRHKRRLQNLLYEIHVSSKIRTQQSRAQQCARLWSRRDLSGSLLSVPVVLVCALLLQYTFLACVHCSSTNGYRMSRHVFIPDRKAHNYAKQMNSSTTTPYFHIFAHRLPPTHLTLLEWHHVYLSALQTMKKGLCKGSRLNPVRRVP